MGVKVLWENKIEVEAQQVEEQVHLVEQKVEQVEVNRETEELMGYGDQEEVKCLPEGQKSNGTETDQ